MNFDLHEINYLQAIATWAVVFFLVFSVAAFVSWLLAPTVAGVGGHRKFFQHLGRGGMTPVCLGFAVIAAIAAGWLTWQFSANARGLVMGIYGAFAPDVEPTSSLRLIDRLTMVVPAVLLSAFGGYVLVPTVLEACTINFARVWTIAMLTWKEAVRRRALYVFVVFAMLFMFAGWFLSTPGEKPDRQVTNYVTFVLTTISWLTLPVMLLLSAWGLPEDIRQRSLHTVVTKPVRRNEIFLGRVVGFSLVGTIVVVVMGTIGYFWIRQQVPAMVTAGVEEIDGRTVEFGVTRRGNFRVSISRTKGEPEVYEADSPADMRQKHPEVFAKYEAARARYINERLLVSRVPVHGKLSFYDRNGLPTEGGINVGDIWEHRSYIECGTRARASYRFEDVGEHLLVKHTVLEVDADGNEKPVEVERLRIETNFEAFRSYKGTLDRSLLVQLHFVKGLRRELGEGLAGIDLNEPGVTDFRPLARAVTQGNFDEAEIILGQLANGFETGALEFSEQSRRLLPIGYSRVADLFEAFDEEWANPLAAAARNVVSAVRAEDSDRMAKALKSLSELVRENVPKLEEEIVDLDVTSTPYTINEFTGNVVYVPRELVKQGTTETVDLFDDLTHGGELRIEVSGLDAKQYLGMARPDLFIRMPDRPFAVGYFKAVLGIWLLLVLVVLVGVTVSTFVKGPVATLAVCAFVGVGTSHGFLMDLVTGKAKDLGSIESGYKLYAHLNPQVDLDKTTATALVKGADQTINGFLWVVANVIPDLDVFFLNKWIASGFDIRWDAGLAPAVFTLLSYLLPCLLLGFYSLKLRELEAK